MKRPLLLLGLLALVPLSLAAAEPDPFPGLKSYEIKGYLTVAIHYDPQITQLVNKRLTTEEEPLVVRVFRTKLDRTKDEWYFIDYDEGPSADPEFIVTKEGAQEPAGSMSGLHLYLPGNGLLYASGHTNNMFDEHRKYVLKGGKLEETKQPYLYVGLTGPAKKDLTLYASTAMKEAVAAIPKGTAMTVVLSDGQDNYVVKTAFGLLGWVKIPGDSQEATVIEGLFFAGD